MLLALWPLVDEVALTTRPARPVLELSVEAARLELEVDATAEADVSWEGA